mgnify:CR=1 FL=1
MEELKAFFDSIVDFILDFVNTIKDLVANVSGG